MRCDFLRYHRGKKKNFLFNDLLLGKITVLIFSFFIIFPSIALSAGPNYLPMIQKQAKQIKSLLARVESLENDVYDLKKQILSMPTSERGNNNGQKNTDVDSDNSQSSANVSSPNISNSEKEKNNYDEALGLLKGSQLLAAEHKFADFIKTYPESYLQSNAHFWYGESFFRRELYNKAAIQFLKTYQQFPKSVKASDALLKLSLSLGHLQKTEEACNMLDRLEKEFPERSLDSKNRARDAAVKFGCKVK